jgi:hypothetical protein
MASLTLSLGQKFAMLMVENVYAELPGNDYQLSDGTWVLSRIPVEIEAHWAKWIGTLRTEKMQTANLVLLRAVNSNNPTLAGDKEQIDLTQHLVKLFSMLQLDGVPEYAEAEIVAGAVLEDGSNIRHVGKLPDFRHTKGYVKNAVDIPRLEVATKLREALEQIEGMLSSNRFVRFMRGLNVLRDGLLQTVGQERIHQFVRSLEALVLPEVGSTKKQFVHRCQTFAKASAQSKTVLEEAFDMRSDTEHLQDWNRALQSHPASEREDVALQRTRQMERLATNAYSRILGEKALWAHFQDDRAQQAFWRLAEVSRNTIWGKQVDVGAIPIVRKYDGWNRAA